MFFFLMFLNTVTIGEPAHIDIYVDINNEDGPWDGTEDNPYKTIGEAVEHAAVDSIIFVLKGEYTENILITIPMSVIGQQMSSTIIDGNDSVIFTITSDNVTIKNFTLFNASTAISLSSSINSTIQNNTLLSNNFGISLGNNCNNNTIFSNNFIDNTKHAIDPNINHWFKQSRGNYWDDYNGFDNDSNGIGDIPYNISEGVNQDRYPLMEPITRKPICDFSFTPEKPDTFENISFIDDSSDPDGFIVSSSWDFGDGKTSEGIINITHIYENRANAYKFMGFKTHAKEDFKMFKKLKT